MLLSPATVQSSTRALIDRHFVAYMTIPPSTFMTWPVTYAADGSVARKSTMPATSSGCPYRPAYESYASELIHETYTLTLSLQSNNTGVLDVLLFHRLLSYCTASFVWKCRSHCDHKCIND